jgi:DNA-binding NtrC family response regulator
MEPEAAGEHSDRKRRRKRVLVIEEDFLTRWGLAEYLRETGFEILEAVGADEAKAILDVGTPVDAVLCDVGLTLDLDRRVFWQWAGHQRPELPMLLATNDLRTSGVVAEGSNRQLVAKPYDLSDIERQLTNLLSDK